MKNIIIAQSGGPTAVINSSVAGLVLTALKNKNIGKVYGAFHGIQGVLDDNLILFNDIDSKEIEYMKTTPSAALGSCRVKIKENHYEDIFNMLSKYNIDMFFYTGGNDSMDTVDKLSKYAKENNIDIQFIGIPKTIDNDLEEIDHTPGFGSCSKFIVSTIAEMNRDAIVYDKKTVTIIEVMGRDTGWISASSGACFDYEGVPDLIYIPEIPFTLEQYEKDVLSTLDKKGSCFVVVSEGVKFPNGEFVSDSKETEVDSFGHKRMGGVHNVLKDYISSKTEATVKSVEFGIQQRCSITHASKTDLEEAFLLGEYALNYALDGQTGVMSTLRRLDKDTYQVEYSSVDVSLVANRVKYVPRNFMNEKGTNLSKVGVDYFRPLIVGDIVVPKSDGVHRYSKISPKAKAKKA